MDAKSEVSSCLQSYADWLVATKDAWIPNALYKLYKRPDLVKSAGFINMGQLVSSKQFIDVLTAAGIPPSLIPEGNSVMKDLMSMDAYLIIKCNTQLEITKDLAFVFSPLVEQPQVRSDELRTSQVRACEALTRFAMRSFYSRPSMQPATSN